MKKKSNQSTIYTLSEGLIKSNYLAKSQIDKIKKTIKREKFSSLYLEWHGNHLDKLDFSISKSDGINTTWYEFDSCNNSSKFNIFRSSNKNLSSKEVNNFISYILSSSSISNKSKLLYIRALKVNKIIPLQHIGYMGARNAKCLRVCSHSISFQRLNTLLKKSKNKNYDWELLEKIGRICTFKISQNLSFNLQGDIGIEIHPNQKGSTKSWEEVIYLLKSHNFLCEFNKARVLDLISPKIFLSGIKKDTIFTLRPAHLKLTFSGFNKTKLKVYSIAEESRML